VLIFEIMDREHEGINDSLTVVETLDKYNKQFYPLIYKRVRILATLYLLLERNFPF